MDLVYILLRSTFLFLFMMFIIRILGKREVGELSTFDLVVILVIANSSSMGIEDQKMFLPSIACLFSLFLLQKLFSKLLLKYAKLRKIVDGEPSIIAINGKLNYDVMKKESYTVDDLVIQMRENQIMDVRDIKLAILETNGELNVFPKGKFNEIILPVILSGRIIKANLPYLSLTEEDLLNKLKEKKLSLKNVVYASSNGKDLFIPMKS